MLVIWLYLTLDDFSLLSPSVFKGCRVHFQFRGFLRTNSKNKIKNRFYLEIKINEYFINFQAT